MGKIKVIKDQNTFFECDSCGTEIDSESVECPDCGNAVEEIISTERREHFSKSKDVIDKNEADQNITVESILNNKNSKQYNLLRFFSGLSKFIAFVLAILSILIIVNADFELSFYQYAVVFIGVGFVVLNLLFYAQLVDALLDVKEETSTLVKLFKFTEKNSN